jgi:hypothetical protein
MGDDRSAPMQFRDGSEVDRERQYDLLALTQPEVRGFDENAGSAQIDGFAQLSATTRNGDIDNGSCTVPCVQAAFHFNEPRVVLLVVRREQSHYAVVRTRAMHRFNLIAQ